MIFQPCQRNARSMARWGCGVSGALWLTASMDAATARISPFAILLAIAPGSKIPTHDPDATNQNPTCPRRNQLTLRFLCEIRPFLARAASVGASKRSQTDKALCSPGRSRGFPAGSLRLVRGLCSQRFQRGTPWGPRRSMMQIRFWQLLSSVNLELTLQSLSKPLLTMYRQVLFFFKQFEKGLGRTNTNLRTHSLPSCCLATRWWSGCRTRRAISIGSSSSSRRPRVSSASATTLSRCGVGRRCPWHSAAISLVIGDRGSMILGTFSLQRTSRRCCHPPCLPSTAERHAQSQSPVAVAGPTTSQKCEAVPRRARI